MTEIKSPLNVSIISATFNKLELTKAYWESLISNPPSLKWEIIWIDDGSTDGTRDWLDSIRSDNCRVILNKHNQGFAANNNLGAKHANGEILCLLNNDLILTENWFPPLFQRINSSHKSGIIGNVQLQVRNGLIDHAGVYFDLCGCPAHLHKNKSPKKLRGEGKPCIAVTAACWLIKRDVFLNAGGFDESYRNGAEDIDLSLRIHQLGFTNFISYESVIYHHVSSSPGRKLKDLENQALFLKRWGETTAKYGQYDWPKQYLIRSLNNPRKINGPKFLDALLRILKLRHGDSKWAKSRRERLSRPPNLNERKV